MRTTWFTQHFSFAETEYPQVVLSPNATTRRTGSERMSRTRKNIVFPVEEVGISLQEVFSKR